MNGMGTTDEQLTTQLLGEMQWIRRLAASLAGAQADDVAQETWLVATAKQPDVDGSRPLAPWLATVVRTLAHTRRRAETRRKLHETAAGSEPAREAENPEASLERAQLLHLLGELVGQLEEPYRTTVLLRYYEGLDAPAIAKKLDVSDGTVRWRLKHAVTQLKKQLDARVDGGRRAWKRLLAPLAPLPAAAKGATAMVTLFKIFGTAAVLSAMGAAGIHYVAGEADDKPPAVAAPDPAALIQDAQKAYVEGRYGDAIDYSRRAEAAEPSMANRIIGASSCFLKDGKTAAAAAAKLDDQSRKFVEYVCGRNDVQLPDGKPVL